MQRGTRRGYATSIDRSEVSDWEQRPCTECGKPHLAKALARAPLCFDCRPPSPFSANVSIEVGCENSTDPRRVADGSAIFNVGLPGVETVIGTRPDGRPRTSYRPVTNDELGTARARREYAKRAGLEPAITKVKRVVGGK